jgi:hypothetical protein
VVTKVASVFCKSRLSIHPVICSRIDHYEALSDNERRRIYRALYRFELFRDLFPRENSADTTPDDMEPFDPMDISHLYLSLFHPWEAEEIACIREFFMDFYGENFVQLSDELNLFPQTHYWRTC